jgi:hypothetical protein
MARRKRLGIRSFVLRGDIPGVHADGEDGLVQSRTVPEVVVEKSRAAQLLGDRSATLKSNDGLYRDLGIPIFDVNAGRQQLADLLQRGRDK